jgi:hypothetical protein
MDKKTLGAWVIHHTQKLQQVSNALGFDRIPLAGKAGTLLSHLSKTRGESNLSAKAVETIAQAAGINAVLELPTLLDRLEDARLIQRSSSGEVQVLGLTTASVLAHTADIFNSCDPEPSEMAAIDVSELASASPVKDTLAREYLGDRYELATPAVRELLNQAEQIGFIDAEPVSDRSKLLFNGNLFRRDDARKATAILDSLSPKEMQSTAALEEKLKEKGCISREEAMYTSDSRSS